MIDCSLFGNFQGYDRSGSHKILSSSVDGKRVEHIVKDKVQSF